MNSGSVTPSGSHLQAAAAVFSSIGAKIFQRLPSPDWDFALGEKLSSQLIAFLQSVRSEIGDHPCGFELTQRTDGVQPLNARHMVEANGKQPHLIRLDRDLHFIEAVPLACEDPRFPSEVDFSGASSQKVVAFYEDRNLVRFYSNGYTAGSVQLDNPAVRPPKAGRFVRGADDFELSIRDHFNQRVKFWQGTQHWSDRPKRILHQKCGSLKTEAIFHNSLFLWLEQNISGDVKSQARDINSDEPDIHITSFFDARHYLVELKWLGTNGKTGHSVEQVRKAFGQMSDYLKKHSTVKRGTLVIYDGRSQEDFDALECAEKLEDGCIRIFKCGQAKLSARGECLVMFLESKTASEQ